MPKFALYSAAAICLQVVCVNAHASAFDDVTNAPLQTPLHLQLDESLQVPDFTLSQAGDALPTTISTASSDSTWPPASRKEFLAAVWPHAERAARKIGVTPHALVAQAALESAWGRRAIGADGQPSYNLFGIKAGPAWTGERIEVATHEYVRGKRRDSVADFRSYESIGEAFDDYVSMLRANSRYKAALKHGGTSRHFAARLQKAGYSTDPHYAKKIHQIANSHIVRGQRAITAARKSKRR